MPDPDNGPRGSKRENVQAALIYSGSQVTTVSDHLWRTHPRLRTQPLRNAGITVTGADDKDVQELGALEIDLEVLVFKYSGCDQLWSRPRPHIDVR